MKVEYQNRIIDGISTAFAYRKGKGPVIVCIHGNSLSKTDFLPLWEDSLLESRPMVIYDLPGHGGSGHTENHQKMYTLSGYAEHLKALIHSLELKEIVLAGFSLGGHIAMEAAAGGLPGVKALFLVGSPPIGTVEDFPKAFLPQPDGVSLFNKSITPKEAAIFAGRLTSNIKLHAHIAETILSTDPDARSALMQDLLNQEFFNEIQFIQSAQFPVTLIFGKVDRIINPAYVHTLNLSRNSKVKIQMMANGEHIPDWNAPGGVNSILSNLMQRLDG